MGDSEIRGRLLLASPDLGDPNFHRTVVFIIEHTVMGALGVVLNRPTPHAVSETVPGWEGIAAAPGVVFSGGPVEGRRILGLGRGKPCANGAVAEQVEGAEGSLIGAWTPLVGRIGMVDLSQSPSHCFIVMSIRNMSFI